MQLQYLPGLAVLWLILPNLAHAAGRLTINTGDTAWTLIACSITVLIIPGLAIFQSGVLSTRSTTSNLVQNYLVLPAVGLLWVLCGYSLVYSGDYVGIIGNFDWFFLKDVSADPHAEYAPTVPHILFMLRQCIFAILPPVLLTGGLSEKYSHRKWLGLMLVWSIAVYFPVAHWTWAPEGWIHRQGALDFAGGLVTHLTAGVSGLMIWLNSRSTEPVSPKKGKAPNSDLTLVGIALTVFAWVSMNAGAMQHANGLAAHAMVTTLLSSIASLAMWSTLDWILDGETSPNRAAMGTLAGLVAITSGAGYVSLQGAISIGLICGGLCQFACRLLKGPGSSNLFCCHAVGGILGTILLGVFAEDGLLSGKTDLIWVQLVSVVAVTAYVAFLSLILARIARPIRSESR